MSKKEKIWIGVAVLAVVIYFGISWWKQHMTQTPGGGPEGSNLNSVAPELIGGSAGPSVGPALSVPVNINLTESGAAPQAAGNVPMQGVNAVTPSSLSRANPPVSDDSGVDAGTVTDTGAGSPGSMAKVPVRHDRTKGGDDNTDPHSKSQRDEKMARDSERGKK